MLVGCYSSQLQGCRRSRSSHGQEPLAGDSPVFPDITTFVSGGEGRGLGFPFSPARLLQLKWPCQPAPCQRHGFLYLGRGLNTGDPDLELGRGDGGSFVSGSSTFCDFLTKNRGQGWCPVGPSPRSATGHG